MKFNPSSCAFRFLLIIVIALLSFTNFWDFSIKAQSTSKLFSMVKRANLTTVTSLKKRSQDTLPYRLDSIITAIFVDFFSTAKFISQKGRPGAAGKNKLSQSFLSEVLLERGFIFGDSGKVVSSYEVSIGKGGAFGQFQIYFDAAFVAPKKYFSWRQLDSLTEITMTQYFSPVRSTTPHFHKIFIDYLGGGLYETRQGSEKPEIFYWDENGAITKKPYSKLLFKPSRNQ